MSVGKWLRKKSAMQGGSQQPYENYHTGPETDSRRTKKLMHQRFERGDKKTAAVDKTTAPSRRTRS